MRIVIDCRWILSKKFDGIGRFILQTTKELLRLDRENEYVLLFSSRELADWVDTMLGDIRPSVKANYKIHLTKYPVLSFADILWLRRDLRKIKPDIFICTHYLSWPFSSKYKTCLIVYDLIPFMRREVCTTWKWKLFYGFSFLARRIFQKADKIITISRFTKKDLIEKFRLAASQIEVVDCGVNDIFYKRMPTSRLRAIQQKYLLPKYFLLCVSRQQPYKNLVGLARAYALLPEELKSQYKLVLTGEKHRLYSADLQKSLDELIEKKQVVFTGFVEDEDLPAVYQSASLFVLPSLYEGFGLPILEAMASNCPVVCSRVTSLPEVGGEAVAYFDPADSENMMDVIEDLLTNELKRKRLVEAGEKRVAQFSWARCAGGIYDALLSLGK